MFWIWIITLIGCSSPRTAQSQIGIEEQIENEFGKDYAVKYNTSKTFALYWQNQDDMDEVHDYIIADLKNQKFIYENLKFRGVITWETDSVIKIRRITGLPASPETQNGITYFDLIKKKNINITELKD